MNRRQIRLRRQRCDDGNSLKKNRSTAKLSIHDFCLRTIGANERPSEPIMARIHEADKNGSWKMQIRAINKARARARSFVAYGDVARAIRILKLKLILATNKQASKNEARRLIWTEF